MPKIANGRPNLFDFATSELSQDAFICWLVSWADAKFEKTNADLYNVSRKFLARLADLEDISKHAKIEVMRQYKNIDILVSVENISDEKNYLILIEDKTSTRDHGGQLNRYYSKIFKETQGDDQKHLDWRVKPIYFFTGDEGNANRVKQSGYTPFNRKKFLKILRQGKNIKNEIFRDFTDRLEIIESRTLAYKTTPLKEWTYHNWQGFFWALCENLNETNKFNETGEGADFFHVPNQGGGFLACVFPLIPKTWSLNRGDESKRDIYCQLEARRSSNADTYFPNFTVRLATDSKNETQAFRGEIRPELRKVFNGHSYKQANRLGKSTCVLIFDDIFQIKDDGKIDFDKTMDSITNLRSTAKQLSEFEPSH
ncbi:PD-(D/E)XK nuclease family protein [Litorimonas haliclonae]|uniref:PD-(D/E)XK nuclease family protein n=1 Tax=Litorimonas haliclonae TaxID=2081977 RepID=UPI0039EE6AF7